MFHPPHVVTIVEIGLPAVSVDARDLIRSEFEGEGGGRLRRTDRSGKQETCAPTRRPAAPPLTHGLALMHSTSSLISTSSPTTSPPLSRALLQFIPKSLRFSFPSAVKPARTFPQGSLVTPFILPTRVISFVTPSMVKSPTAV